jgi:hypothetical protein
LRYLYQILGFIRYTTYENYMKTWIVGLLIILTSLFFLSGCSKELSVETKQDSSGVVGPDTTYQPMETGSVWVYQDSATMQTSTLTAVDSQVTINSKSYTVFQLAVAGQTKDEYFGINGHDYYSYGDFGDGLIFIELLYINDTASVGYNWQTNAGTINGFPAQDQGVIVETGISKTVGGNTYTNVIHSQVDLQYDFGSGYTTYATFDYYVAKGVGIISIASNFPSLGFSEVLNLVSYNIK